MGAWGLDFRKKSAVSRYLQAFSRAAYIFSRAAATFSHLSVLTLSVILILSRDDIHYILSIKKTGDTSYTCHLTV